MNAEILIYIYLYICSCIIIFDLYYIIYDYLTNKIHAYKQIHHAKTIKNQISQLEKTGTLDIKGEQKLKKELKFSSNLIIFVKALEDYPNKNKSSFLPYYASLIDLFIDLSYYYKKKKPEFKAYFAYIIYKMEFGKYPQIFDQNFLGKTNQLVYTLLDFLKSKSVYARENAIRAIISFNQHQYVIKLINILNRDYEYVNKKLLVDNLLAFNGDTKALSKHLLDKFSNYCPKIQAIIIDYFRLLPFSKLEQKSYYPIIFEFLTDENVDKEVHLAIIRYFRKHSYSKAYKEILQTLKNPDLNNWEYPSVAASALYNYPTDDTIKTLIKSTSSTNWYIRFNSAESLISLGIHLDQKVLKKLDPFAQAMLNYRDDVHKIKAKGGEKP